MPSKALATPAPSSSATCSSSGAAPRAPAPARIATRLPALSTSAAARTAASSGTVSGHWMPMLEGTILKSWVGAEYSSSWTSAGMITAVTVRLPMAVRIARSSTLGSCSGTVTMCT